VEDLPASERFFAGGDTMRGFALDQLGAPGTIDANGFPNGGNALLILNAELRVPLRGGLGVVGFFDSGNVFARMRHFDLGSLRTAAGLGVRYRSPVGPIRVDVGFKLRRHVVAGRQEDLTAIHISLGQAF
jgi:outer membrane protein insertion porin family